MLRRRGLGCLPCYALDVARSITGQVPDYEVLAREAELAGASRLAWPAPRDLSEAIDDAEYDLATAWPLLNTNRDDWLMR